MISVIVSGMMIRIADASRIPLSILFNGTRKNPAIPDASRYVPRNRIRVPLTISRGVPTRRMDGSYMKMNGTRNATNAQNLSVPSSWNPPPLCPPQ